MGMTINKAISHLETYSSTMGSGQTTQAQHEEAKRVAIDSMRKYQKIIQIYQKWDEVNDFSYNQAMSKIGEIISYTEDEPQKSEAADGSNI